jgi:hypothetical protein
VLFKRILGASRRAHGRLTTLLWCAGWTIPLVIVVFALSIPFWQEVVAETEQAVAQHVDFEDGELCVKFGFVTGEKSNASCKLDLLALRHSHERLVEGAALP